MLEAETVPLARFFRILEPFPCRVHSEPHVNSGKNCKAPQLVIYYREHVIEF